MSIYFLLEINRDDKKITKGGADILIIFDKKKQLIYNLNY